MKVQMRDSMGGEYFTYSYGDVIDVEDKREALRWIEKGVAVAAPADAPAKHIHRAHGTARPVRETATAPAAAETATDVKGGEPRNGLSGGGSPALTPKAERVRGASDGRKTDKSAKPDAPAK